MINFEPDQIPVLAEFIVSAAVLQLAFLFNTEADADDFIDEIRQRCEQQNLSKTATSKTLDALRASIKLTMQYKNQGLTDNLDNIKFN